MLTAGLGELARGVPIATIETILEDGDAVCPHWVVMMLNHIVNPHLPAHAPNHAVVVMAIATGTWRDVARHVHMLSADDITGAFALVPNNPSARTKAAVLEARVRELAKRTGPRGGCDEANHALHIAVENEHPYSMLALLDCVYNTTN